jgi:glycogen debranching enzyme/bacterioferritin-associated ferredoxin
VWAAGTCSLKTNSVTLDSIMERSFRDLQMLRSSVEGEYYYAAGVPWFATLFGRDSIISALQTLAYDPSIARQTLRILAKYQGTNDDLWREEEPGKIMHEIRVGELAHIGEVPHNPYYGTVDATPLFLVLAARYHAWTGDSELFRELLPSIEAASDWMRAGARATGYITYETTSAKGLTNQGWKDSENGIQNSDGSLALPPIALVEVQAYAYRARRELADLYVRLGDPKHGLMLRHEADELRERFNRDYWMPSAHCYALALAGEGRRADVCSSNAGHQGHDRAAAMADSDEVCGCNGVTKGTICKTINDKGLFTLEEVRKHTKASASCGSCTGLVEQLLMFAAGGDYSAAPRTKAMCGCTDHSYQ